MLLATFKQHNSYCYPGSISGKIVRLAHVSVWHFNAEVNPECIVNNLLNVRQQKYQLCKLSDNAQGIPLQYDKLLSDQVEDGEELMISSA